MILIIDGHSIAYRAFFKTPSLINSKGVPTGIIHTFLNILLKLNINLQPERIFIAFDSKGATHRHLKLKEYKSERQPAPDDLILQIEELKNLIPTMGMQVCVYPGYEADDIIYTLVNKLGDSDVYIVSKDKDMLQLVNDKVKIFDDSNEQEIGKDEVYNKFGVNPDQIVDMLALAGDAADNIPGVKGIGVKTAARLLNEFGDIEKLYKNISDVKDSIRRKLESNQDLAFLSKEIASLKIVDDLDIIDIDKEPEKLEVILKQLELRSIYKRLFPKGGNESLKDYDAMNSGAVNDIKIIAHQDGGVYKIGPCTYEKADPKDIDMVNTYYNYKDIYKKYKKQLENFYDISIISWLCDPDSDLVSKNRDEALGTFFARLLNTAHLLKDELKLKNLEQVYFDIECKIIVIIAEMELKGIKLDVKKISDVRDRLEKLKLDIENKVFTELGFSFNLNSPKQLSFALYEKLNIHPVKKTKTGLSTSEDTLKELAVYNAGFKGLLENILYYREISKLLSTYTLKLVECVNDKTGRIHSVFKQTGTATGRLSSSNPNLQTIPQKGELSKDIRSAFVAEYGYKFISFDYSQIELRILAHLSGDKNLIAAFRDGVDIHDLTARSLLSYDGESVPQGLRRLAKAVNFGIIYGLTSYGLSRDAGVSREEAKKFIERYFYLYPSVKDFIRTTISDVRKKGYTTTMMGRRRYIKDINSRNSGVMRRAERIAINAPIQGSASDIIKLAMIKCCEYISEESMDAYLVLQVHDELIFEVNSESVGKFYNDVSSIMSNVVKIDAGLTVYGSTGDNLGEMKH